MKTLVSKTVKRRLCIALMLVSLLLSAAPAVLADGPVTQKVPDIQPCGYSWGG